MATTAETLTRKIQDRLSVEAVALRLDDVPPTELGGVIEDALTQIDEHCWLRYPPEALLANDWVLERAADLGAFLLCERRDNCAGPGMTRKYERALERLEKVRLGNLQIPNCATRKASAPVTSGMRVRLDPFPRSVVELYRSTGKAQGYTQNRDSLEWRPDYSI